MAISATVKLQLPASQLPSGSSNDTLSDLSAETTAQEFFSCTLTPASTYDNATQATALTAIKAAVETYVEGTLGPLLGIDAAATIIGDAVITSIERDWDNFTKADKQNQYKAATDVFKVTGYFKWYKD